MAEYKLGNLPILLIEARKTAKISQWELSKRLKVHPNQVARDERTKYKGAGFERLLKVVKALDLDIDLIVKEINYA
jgi:predicted transcriptional regulator